MTSNRKLGNDFESEFCEILAENGYWVHNFALKKSGQPADVIAVKKGNAYLVDCKVCENDKFPFSRIEENQELSMKLWEDCDNGRGWFALKTSKGIYMLSHFFTDDDYDVGFSSCTRKSLNLSEIEEKAYKLEEWI